MNREQALQIIQDAIDLYWTEHPNDDGVTSDVFAEFLAERRCEKCIDKVVAVFDGHCCCGDPKCLGKLEDAIIKSGLW
jgi:hypothetical protein